MVIQAGEVRDHVDHFRIPETPPIKCIYVGAEWYGLSLTQILNDLNYRQAKWLARWGYAPGSVSLCVFVPPEIWDLLDRPNDWPHWPNNLTNRRYIEVNCFLACMRFAVKIEQASKAHVYRATFTLPCKKDMGGTHWFPTLGDSRVGVCRNCGCELPLNAVAASRLPWVLERSGDRGVKTACRTWQEAVDLYMEGCRP